MSQRIKFYFNSKCILQHLRLLLFCISSILSHVIFIILICLFYLLISFITLSDLYRFHVWYELVWILLINILKVDEFNHNEGIITFFVKIKTYRTLWPLMTIDPQPAWQRFKMNVWRCTDSCQPLVVSIVCSIML